MGVASQPFGDPHRDPLTKHVLLICDNREASEAIEMELISLGLTVQTTWNGQALVWLRHDKFSGVVLDLDSPGRHRDLLNEICDMYPSLPIIIVTEFPDTDEAVYALKIGVVDYVVKPLTRERIKDTIDRCLGPGR